MALMRALDHPAILTIPLRKIFFMAVDDVPAEYPRWCNLAHTERNYEDDLRYAEFGAVPQVAEGQVPQMDNAPEGGKKRYQPIEFKLGFSMTQVLMEDDLHGITGRMVGALRKSFRYLYEAEAYKILNNSTSTASSRFTGFDSLALLSTAHTNLANSDTQSNKPSTDVTLSQLALEAAGNAFHGWTNEHGFPSYSVPRLVIGHYTDQYKMAKLLRNAWRYDTANREENWVRQGPDDNGIREYIPSRWFSVANQWFVLGDKAEHDLNMVIRKDPQFETTTHELSGNFIAWGRTRFITSFGRWYGIYGSKGY